MSLLSENEKTYLHTLSAERPEARLLLHLLDNEQLTLNTLRPLYAQLRDRKQQANHRCDWLYSHVERLHFQLKYLSSVISSPQHYRVCQPVVGESRFARQTSGGGNQYGHVILQLRPLPPVMDTPERSEPPEPPAPAVCEWQIAKSNHPHLIDTIPPEFEPTIRTAIATQLADYAQAGFCLVDTRVIVCGGSFHPIDSKSRSYEIAAIQALSAAINGANLVQRQN